MKNDCLDAVTAVLDEAGIAHTVGHGGKHYRIDFEVNGRRCRTTCPVTPSDYRAALNGASQVRRIIRQAQEETAEREEVAVTAEPSNETALVLIEREGNPYALDTDIGARLGYGRADSVRVTIERNRKELEGFGTLHQIDAKSAGGRPSKAYLLNEEQATLVVMFARTSRAAEVRREIVSVFTAWRRGHLTASLPPELVEIIRRVEGMTKMLSHKAAASEKMLAAVTSELADAKAGSELALEAVTALRVRVDQASIAPTVDLASTITSDDLISLAGIKPGQRVRGTSAFVTGRVLTFTAGHGCFKTPAHLNPSMPWRFPREKGTEWLFGAQLGAEQIRNQIERQRRKKAQRARPAHQGHLSLVGAP